MNVRLFALCLVLAPLLAAQSKEIEELDKTWVKAVLAKDLGALDRMMSPEIVYAHASGVVDTKKQYLEKLGSGRQQYKSFDQRNITVKRHGTTAITHSWVRVTGVNAQGPFDDRIMMIHVWIKQTAGWILAAHQTTRVDKLPW
ncbi:MAG: nuclear transport factor 2 family protein [Acidobacteria bacterium]|nr:nuclear transport factor 2 family protein [Acidobacteriota bacterium]